MHNTFREAAWLLGCYGLSIACTGAVVGYQVAVPWRTLDIQLHNTYFIVPGWLALLPLFLAAATPLTLVRAAQARFARRSTNLALGGLAVVWLLLGALMGFWMWQGRRG